MFKYTKAAINRINADLKRLANLATILMQSVMIIYLVISMIVEQGKLIVNAILAAITATYFVVFLIHLGKEDKRSKENMRINTKIYFWSRIIINAFNLGSVIYSIYISASNVSPITYIITPILIILWVGQVALEVIKEYVKNRFVLFVDGLEMDFEFIIKPVNQAKSFFDGLIGEHHEEVEYVSEKNRRILEEQAGCDSEAKKKEPSYLIKLFNRIKDGIVGLFKKKPKEAPNGSSDVGENEPTVKR